MTTGKEEAKPTKAATRPAMTAWKAEGWDIGGNQEREVAGNHDSRRTTPETRFTRHASEGLARGEMGVSFCFPSFPFGSNSFPKRLSPPQMTPKRFAAPFIS